MTKNFKFINLSLCATTCAVMAHADRIDYAIESRAPSTELAALSQTNSSDNAGYFSLSQVADLRRLVYDGGAAGRVGPVSQETFSHVFDGFRTRSGNVGTHDSGPAKQVPDASSTLGLLGLSALSLVAMRRKFLSGERKPLFPASV